MTGDEGDAESEAFGKKANVPAHICQRTGTFEDLDGYDGECDTDATTGHDAWGVE